MNIHDRPGRMGWILLAACVGLGACEERRSPTTTPPESTTPETTPPPATPDTTTDTTHPGENEHSPVTPLDQGETEADRAITAAIRRAILAQEGMSTGAQNCVIVTHNGVVTLRGTVATQAERDAVEAQAKAVSGVVSVVNELEVSR